VSLGPVRSAFRSKSHSVFCRLQTCSQKPFTTDGVPSAKLDRAGARRRVSKALSGMPQIRAAAAADANPERTIRTAYSSSISITQSLRIFDSRLSFAKLGQRVRTQLASLAYRSRVCSSNLTERYTMTRARSSHVEVMRQRRGVAIQRRRERVRDQVISVAEARDNSWQDDHNRSCERGDTVCWLFSVTLALSLVFSRIAVTA
jgi:hypothetical protein